jgi:hypothetical protein
LRICPLFDELDEIFGTRASITPPYVHDSEVEVSNGVSQLENEMEFPVDEMPQDIIQENSSKKSDPHVPSKSKKRGSDETGLDILAKTAQLRFQIQNGELDLSKEKWQYEKQRRENMDDLEQRKFEHEKFMAEQRMDLERKKVENDFELAKFRIEQEFKLKLEQSKL